MLDNLVPQAQAILGILLGGGVLFAAGFAWVDLRTNKRLNEQKAEYEIKLSEQARRIAHLEDVVAHMRSQESSVLGHLQIAFAEAVRIGNDVIVQRIEMATQELTR